jgi:molybdate transport system substrate-binding protein
MLKRFLGAVAALALGVSAAAARADEVVVFAAASTTNAVTEIGQMFTAKSGTAVKSSFASSSTLAKQIEQGAPAQIFISADQKWADYLDQKKLLAAGSRSNLLGNSLVLIAPSDTKSPDLKIEQGFDLVAALQGGRLSVGDPDHVPAGIYAKEALTNLGVWPVLEPRLARQNDVRAALALVERGEAPFGIVYSTDASVSKGVKVIGTFPASSHKPVSYPVALVAGHDTPAAKAFLEFLKSPAAKAVFKKYGFVVP